MNRHDRRQMKRLAKRQINQGRKKAVAKRQWGFGFVLTNQMFTITFWRWVWTPWDRRLCPSK